MKHQDSRRGTKLLHHEGHEEHEGILLFTLCVLRALGGERSCSASGLAPQPARRRDRNNPLNVGGKLLGGCNTPFGIYYTPRGYEKMDVASYLVCDVTFDATKLYMKL